MLTLPQRFFLGFVAGALSALTFHQGVVSALHMFGLARQAPFQTLLIPPFGVPAIVSLCFWSGLYGAAFGALMPRFRVPLWLAGVGLGAIAVLVGWFIIAPLKGLPIAAGFDEWPMARSLLINLCWGLGVGLLLPLLSPRPLLSRRSPRRRALG
jgi:hypothetical protein